MAFGLAIILFARPPRRKNSLLFSSWLVSSHTPSILSLFRREDRRNPDTASCCSSRPNRSPRHRDRAGTGTHQSCRQYSVRSPYMLWYDTPVYRFTDFVTCYHGLCRRWLDLSIFSSQRRWYPCNYQLRKLEGMVRWWGWWCGTGMVPTCNKEMIGYKNSGLAIRCDNQIGICRSSTGGRDAHSLRSLCVSSRDHRRSSQNGPGRI